MDKKIVFGILLIIVIGSVIFLLTKQDPMVLQAREELRQAEAVLQDYQNKVNDILFLELSQDVKNDFKIESNYLGVIGYIVPDSEPSSEVMTYIGEMVSAAERRGSTEFYFNLDEGLSKVSENIIKASEVTNKDLNNLEELANTFDVHIEQVKSNPPQLIPLTVERNKKTEEYFLEFDRTEQRLNSLIASLNNYSSTDFRERIKKLKSANELFSEIAAYTQLLIEGKSFGYSLDVSKVFPELNSEEKKVKTCSQSPYSAGCEASGPFPGGYQPLLQKLETIYSKLTKD